MGKANNRQAYPGIDSRYLIVAGERGRFYNLCTYCGDPADTRDHVPPISRVSDYEAFGLRREVYIKVPCCRECNSLAGDTLQDNILERAEFIKGKLARKYLHRVSLVEWDEDELDELGPILRTKVVSGRKMAKRAQDRVNYYAGIDAVMAQIDPDCYGEPNDAEKWWEGPTNPL